MGERGEKIRAWFKGEKTGGGAKMLENWKCEAKGNMDKKTEERFCCHAGDKFMSWCSFIICAFSLKPLVSPLPIAKVCRASRLLTAYCLHEAPPSGARRFISSCKTSSNL